MKDNKSRETGRVYENRIDSRFTIDQGDFLLFFLFLHVSFLFSCFLPFFFSYQERTCNGQKFLGPFPLVAPACIHHKCVICIQLELVNSMRRSSMRHDACYACVDCIFMRKRTCVRICTMALQIYILAPLRVSSTFLFIFNSVVRESTE